MTWWKNDLRGPRFTSEGPRNDEDLDRLRRALRSRGRQLVIMLVTNHNKILL